MMNADYDIEDLIEEEGLEGRTGKTCENYGHVHVTGDEWVPVVTGICAPSDTAPTLRELPAAERVPS